jgi:beta-glucosidase
MRHKTIDGLTKSGRWFIALLLLVPALSAFAGAPDSRRPPDPHVERMIDSLVSVMTLGEKLGQLNQILAAWNEKEKKPYLDDKLLKQVREGRVGSFLNVVGAAETRAMQKIAVEETRLHIPLLFGLDVIHGFRTIFPIPLAEAGSWDPELIERAERIAASEAAASGINWTFAPMVDIARDPRWGRIAEGAGEDPYLGSVIAAARVRGFQSTDLRDSSTLLACAKHYAAYGGAEGGRDYNTVDFSERTIREVYLPPFNAAVDAGAGSLMSAFNEVSGIPSSANRWLLTDVLRKEWGFDGFVVSDWTAIEELQKHGIAGSRAEAGIKAISAGVDMDMVSGIYVDDLPGMVRAGKLPESIVDESVRRVLRMKFRIGLFENPFRNCTPGLDQKVILTPEHLRAAKELAGESIVLLKNDLNLLPLHKNIGTLALIGPLVDDSTNLLGPWAGAGKSNDVVTVLNGIRNRLKGETRILVAKGCAIDSPDTSGFGEAASAATQADVVVLVAGEAGSMSGEASSRSGIGLPGVQRELVERMIGTGKPVVLILMNGRPLALPWEAEHVPAILESWFLGVQAGNAIADVLFGDINPGGKLPVSFPRSVGQIPLYYSHKPTGRPENPEDHYTSKYMDMPNSPQFPFGFGLSYTNYIYTDLRVREKRVRMQDTVRVSVRVQNTGRVAGDEIVQLYIHDEVASVTRPVLELKRFQRIHLEPNESKVVRFALTAGDLAFYDAGINRVTEPGIFTLFVGPNSVDRKEVEFELVAE